MADDIMTVIAECRRRRLPPEQAHKIIIEHLERVERGYAIQMWLGAVGAVLIVAAGALLVFLGGVEWVVSNILGGRHNG